MALRDHDVQGSCNRDERPDTSAQCPARTGENCCSTLPAGPFTNGWVRLLEDSELALLLMRFQLTPSGFGGPAMEKVREVIEQKLAQGPPSPLARLLHRH